VTLTNRTRRTFRAPRDGRWSRPVRAQLSRSQSIARATQRKVNKQRLRGDCRLITSRDCRVAAAAATTAISALLYNIINDRAIPSFLVFLGIFSSRRWAFDVAVSPPSSSSDGLLLLLLFFSIHFRGDPPSSEGAPRKRGSGKETASAAGWGR